MQLLLAFGILAIASVKFSHTGAIGKLGKSIQATKQLTEVLNDVTEADKQNGCDPEPCVPGGEFDSDCDGIEGTAGTDYPNFPFETIHLAFLFNCSAQTYPGFYADPEFDCQVYHICADGQQWASICNIGTIFDQSVRNCVYYKDFNCSTAESLYEVNIDSFKPKPCLPSYKEATKEVQAGSLKNTSRICLNVNGEVKQVQAVSVELDHQDQSEVVQMSQLKRHAPDDDLDL